VLIACVETEIFREKVVEVSAQMISIVANAIAIFRKKEKMEQNSKTVQMKYKTAQKFKFTKHKYYEKILKFMNTPFTNNQKL
jgi:ethanolamine transporter EutH